MESFITQYFGEWGGWIIGALIALIAKDSITQFWSGFRFLMGSDFDVDDIVYINGTKKARIIRQGIYKTTFYVYDHERKFIVPNDRLWALNIEKQLPKYEDKQDAIK
jgi:small-conductance mechanosensitive channel